MATSAPNLVKISEIAAEFLAIFLFFKMAAGRHLGFSPTDLYDHPQWRLGGQ